MEARVVVLMLVRDGREWTPESIVLQVDNLFLGAFSEKREKGPCHPVHTEDVDGEALCEVIPVLR